MPTSSSLSFDRYHATMANHSLHPGHGRWETGPLQGKSLADTQGMWYLAQREMAFAPIIGHERLVECLSSVALDPKRREFLEEDRASLGFVAKKLRHTQFYPATIRAVEPGTIMFANEPFATVSGPWALTQLREVLFLQAFDKPTAVSGTALQIRQAVGKDVLLSDFSLRRAADVEDADTIADWAMRGLFDDTSNMEFSFESGVPAVGTMAHHLVQAYVYALAHPVQDAQGKPLHFETYAFMKWLDSHPHGTVLLVDTLDIREGVIRAMEAALSSDDRRKAFKGIRLDSGDNLVALPWVRAMLDTNGFSDIFITVTNEITLQKINELKQQHVSLPYGFGVGSALAQATSGVIFKSCAIHDGEQWLPTVKLSTNKKTFVGPLQVWRCMDDENRYFKDVVALEGEPAPAGPHIKRAVPLLGQWSWSGGNYQPIASPQEQREYVQRQLERIKNIEKYPVEQSASLTKLQEGVAQNMLQYTYPDSLRILP